MALSMLKVATPWLRPCNAITGLRNLKTFVWYFGFVFLDRTKKLIELYSQCYSYIIMHCSPGVCGGGVLGLRSLPANKCTKLLWCKGDIRINDYWKA